MTHLMLMRKNTHLSVAAPLVALLLSGPIPTMAQELGAAMDAKAEIEEIVVTAGKREETLHRVPSSVSALTAEGLEEIGATSFADYAGTVPGLLFQDFQLSSAGRGQQAVIRGVTTGLGASLFSQNTVAIYLDDISLSTFFDPEVAGIERIEVLRGPQGTLYGDRSMGGAIRYITTDPSTSGMFGSIQTGISQTHLAPDTNYRLSGSVNVPLSDDSALLLVGSVNNRAGYVDTDGSDPADTVDSVYIEEGHNTRDVSQLRAKLLFDATDELRILLSGYYEESDIGGSSYYDPEKPELTTTNLFAPDDNIRETTAGNLRIQYDLGWGDLYSSTSFLSDETRIQIPLTPFFQPSVEFAASTVAGVPVDFRDPFRTDERNKSDVFTQEIRLSSYDDGNFNYLIGVYYTDSEGVGSAPAVQPGLAPYNTSVAASLGLTGDGTDVAFDFSGADASSELAGFGEMRFDLADDKVQLTLGGRLFNAESTSLDSSGNVSAESSETDSIFRGSLAWFANDNLTVFGQIAQGYRSGGGNTEIPDPPANYASSFDADTLTNFEIGVKARSANNRLSGSIAAFFIDWEDIQTQFVSPGGFLYGVNAGAAETSGVEVEFSSSPWGNALLSGSLAYLNAEIVEDVPEAGLVDGERLPGTPEYTASINLRERYSIGTRYTLEPGILWTYRDESFAAFGATQGQKLDSYSRLNLSVVLANDESDWSLRLFVDNVTDDRPIVAHYGFRGVPQLVTIRPMTVGMTFSKNWD